MQAAAIRVKSMIRPSTDLSTQQPSSADVLSFSLGEQAPTLDPPSEEQAPTLDPPSEEQAPTLDSPSEEQAPTNLDQPSGQQAPTILDQPEVADDYDLNFDNWMMIPFTEGGSSSGGQQQRGCKNAGYQNKSDIQLKADAKPGSKNVKSPPPLGQKKWNGKHNQNLRRYCLNPFCSLGHCRGGECRGSPGQTGCEDCEGSRRPLLDIMDPKKDLLAAQGRQTYEHDILGLARNLEVQLRDIDGRSWLNLEIRNRARDLADIAQTLRVLPNWRLHTESFGSKGRTLAEAIAKVP